MIDLDALHAAAVDEACEADRGRVAAGEREFVRLARDHEFCVPGLACVTWPTMVKVISLAPDVRLRQPILVPTGAVS